MSKFFDSDGVEITEGCRLVWGSTSADVQNTGIVRVGDSALDIGNFSLVVHVSFFTFYSLDVVLKEANWVMVVPAYPKALVSKVA